MQWGQMRRALPILAARWRREEGEPVSPRSGREQVKAQRPIAGSDWRRMPPIDLAIRSRPVLTGGPLLRPPRVSGTRSLLTREPGDRAAGPGRPDLAVSRLPGRITGIAVPQPASVIGGAKSGAPGPSSGPPVRLGPPAPPQLPSPARLRPAVRMTAAHRQNLIEATGEFVGAPQPEETPYSSSAWLRMLQAYRLPAGGTELADAQLTGLTRPGLAQPELTQVVKPDGGTVVAWSSEAAEPPRHQIPPTEAEPEGPARKAERPRRANLAESRRLGLGTPLSPPPRSSPPRTRSWPGETSDEAQVRQATAATAAPNADPQKSVRQPRAGLGAPIARGAVGSSDAGKPDLTPPAPARPEGAAPLAGRRAMPRPSLRPEPIPPSDLEPTALPPASPPPPPAAPQPARSGLTGSACSTQPAAASRPADPRPPAPGADEPPAPSPMIVVPGLPGRTACGARDDRLAARRSAASGTARATPSRPARSGGRAYRSARQLRSAR